MINYMASVATSISRQPYSCLAVTLLSQSARVLFDLAETLRVVSGPLRRHCYTQSTGCSTRGLAISLCHCGASRNDQNLPPPSFFSAPWLEEPAHAGMYSMLYTSFSIYRVALVSILVLTVTSPLVGNPGRDTGGPPSHWAYPRQ